jgi:hypothetical protein
MSLCAALGISFARPNNDIHVFNQRDIISHYIDEANSKKTEVEKLRWNLEKCTLTAVDDDTV